MLCKGMVERGFPHHVVDISIPHQGYGLRRIAREMSGYVYVFLNDIRTLMLHRIGHIYITTGQSRAAFP